MMDSWFSKQIGDGITAPMLSAQIEEIFLPLFEAAGKPQNMAVFTLYESEGRLHCDVTAYFSPAAANVAKALGAEPCERPSRTELGLLLGDKLSWSVLFPESE